MHMYRGREGGWERLGIERGRGKGKGWKGGEERGREREGREREKKGGGEGKIVCTLCNC